MQVKSIIRERFDRANDLAKVAEHLDYFTGRVDVRTPEDRKREKADAEQTSMLPPPPQKYDVKLPSTILIPAVDGKLAAEVKKEFTALLQNLANKYSIKALEALTEKESAE